MYTAALFNAEQQKVITLLEIICQPAQHSLLSCHVICHVTQGKKARTITEMRNILAQKKQQVTHGLPEWGKDLPEDVSAH